jgi:hypothetical protein
LECAAARRSSSAYVNVALASLLWWYRSHIGRYRILRPAEFSALD